MYSEKLSTGVGSAKPATCVLEGDCVDILKGVPSGFINFVLTDPPYICDYKERNGRSIPNDANGSWLSPAFEQVSRVLTDDSYCVSFYGWSHVELFMRAWRTAGLRPVGHFVFVKPYASSKSFAARHHEQAYLLAKGKPKQPVKKLRDVVDWEYTGNVYHPTQKPLNILRMFIATYSQPGDYVLDPFCGSASTLIAAHQVGRTALGIELDTAYAGKARERLSEFFDKKIHSVR